MKKWIVLLLLTASQSIALADSQDLGPIIRCKSVGIYDWKGGTVETTLEVRERIGWMVRLFYEVKQTADSHVGFITPYQSAGQLFQFNEGPNLTNKSVSVIRTHPNFIIFKDVNKNFYHSFSIDDCEIY
jgi:hypothetical protein